MLARPHSAPRHARAMPPDIGAGGGNGYAFAACRVAFVGADRAKQHLSARSPRP